MYIINLKANTTVYSAHVKISNLTKDNWYLQMQKIARLLPFVNKCENDILLNTFHRNIGSFMPRWNEEQYAAISHLAVTVLSNALI